MDLVTRLSYHAFFAILTELNLMTPLVVLRFTTTKAPNEDPCGDNRWE
jgi:hypothetical protein